MEAEIPEESVENCSSGVTSQSSGVFCRLVLEWRLGFSIRHVSVLKYDV